MIQMTMTMIVRRALAGLTALIVCSLYNDMSYAQAQVPIDSLTGEERIALTVQKPKLTVGVGSAEVTWTTGPNAFSYDYTVSCYPQDVTIPTDNCQAVESSDLVPLAVMTGTLPRLYSKVNIDIAGLPTDSSTIDCFIDIEGPAEKVRKCVPLRQDPFRLALNGVTVTCQDAEVGDTGIVNGIEFTKRDRDGLLALVGNEGTEAELATSCTTGVTNMAELFGYVEDNLPNSYDYSVYSFAADPTTFNPDIATWDISSVTNMHAMLAGSSVFDRDVSAWDTSRVVDMSFLYAGASDFNRSLVGYGWDTSSAENMVGMFYDAQAFNQDLNHFDMAAATNTSYMFAFASNFNNGDESSAGSNPLVWDTTSLTETKFMFLGAVAFNQPVDSFEMASVAVTAGMFAGAEVFNQPIDDWTMSSVERMDAMFLGAFSFNQSVNSWDTNSLTNASYVFFGALSFNQPLDGWDTSGVLDMRAMFLACLPFNQDLSGWDTNQVESFAGTFAGALNFNNGEYTNTASNPLTWNTTAATDMLGMFAYASSFNQAISSFTTSNVETMNGMFLDATDFNQDIIGWDTSSVTNMESMFNNAATFNWDLSAWDVDAVTSCGGFSVGTDNWTEPKPQFTSCTP